MENEGFYYTLAIGKGTIAGLAAVLEDFGARRGWSVKYVYQLNLVLDEVITNAISYGYDNPDEHEISVRLTLENMVIRIIVEDDARQFNPLLEGPQPELHKPLTERVRPVGGMGIHIMKSIMDTVDYRHANGKNILTMEKDLRNCSCG